jgi:DNA repair exonuclease SbcCD ATPase subunit
MSSPDPAHAPVRVYLAALDDLDRVTAALAAAHTDARETERGFEDVLHAVPGAPAPAPAAVLSTATLWRPRDAAQLSALTDVYEVVGRFSFEGDDGANLAATAQFVKTLRAEVERQRASLVDLARVPALAADHAAALEEKELASSRAQQADLLQQFEPAAAQLREIAQKLLGALRAEKKPDLARVDAAEAAYQDYVHRVRALYTKALPFLRAQLAELCRLAGAEVPPSWPDALPFAATLPADLVAAPPPETPALTTARQTLEAMTAREADLARAIDELGVQLRRSDGELTALAQREAEALKDIHTAKVVVRWATKLDELDAVRQGEAAVQSDAQARTQAQLRYRAEAQRVTAAMTALQKDATEWAQGLAAKEQALAERRKDEPALFGKDEWRRKVEELQGEVDELRAELTKRQQQIQAHQGEIVQLQARDQSEQAALAALARQHDELKGRDATLQQEVARIEQELGTARPARRITVAQAEEGLGAIQGARNEARARVERVGAEMRRIREDVDRANVQLRQVQGDRERQQQGLAAAQRQSTAAVDDALRTLASRRQAAFDSHAQQVLSGLEDSLAQVDRVFIDPARRALLVRAGVMTGAPGHLRDRADAFGKALGEATVRAEATFAAELAVVEHVEQDFLARAPGMFRHLWG